MVLLPLLRAIILVPTVGLITLIPNQFIPLACKYFLSLLGVKINQVTDNNDRIPDNAIIVFNHPTFFDHLVVIASIKKIAKFVTLDTYARWFPFIVRKFGFIIVSKSKCSQTQKLQSESGMIAIAPTAGNSNPDESVLPSFRTGAFICDKPIVPVVISYGKHYDDVRWVERQSMLNVIIKRLFSSDVYCNVSILPCFNREENETYNNFADRVKSSIEKELVRIR
jgi:1-acyl-sn-glycerol-3-phosphate acyltransferase